MLQSSDHTGQIIKEDSRVQDIHPNGTTRRTCDKIQGDCAPRLVSHARCSSPAMTCWGAALAHHHMHREPSPYSHQIRDPKPNGTSVFGSPLPRTCPDSGSEMSTDESLFPAHAEPLSSAHGSPGSIEAAHAGSSARPPSHPRCLATLSSLPSRALTAALGKARSVIRWMSDPVIHTFTSGSSAMFCFKLVPPDLWRRLNPWSARTATPSAIGLPHRQACFLRDPGIVGLRPCARCWQSFDRSSKLQLIIQDKDLACFGRIRTLPRIRRSRGRLPEKEAW